MLLFLLFFHHIECYNILGLFPLPAKSHYAVFDPLMTELANRGHNVTVYNAFPKNHSIPNYREVDVSKCFPVPQVSDIAQMDSVKKTDFRAVQVIFHFGPPPEKIKDCEPIMKLVNTSDKFDLLITEFFNNDFFFLFADKFDIPSIAIHSNGLNAFQCERMGLPYNPSYIPNLVSGYSAKMSFFERAHNLMYYGYALFAFEWYSRRKYEAVVKEVFGCDVSKLRNFTRNTSIMLNYIHFSLNHARPMVPNVIEIAGLNIKPGKLLPQVCTCGF